MLFDTYSTLAAEASLDSLWLNTKVITNNLANESTPGYKAQRVNFEEVLSNAQQQQRGTNKASQTSQSGDANQQLQSNVSEGIGSDGVFRTRILTDSARSERVDGNNVSLENEQTELWRTYAQYSYLLDRIQGHYSTISTAINNMRT